MNTHKIASYKRLSVKNAYSVAVYIQKTGQ